MVYSVAPITAATSYFWTVPSGVIIIAGAGTNSITVNFSNGALSGNITVKGHNALCGDGVSSIMPVIVDHLPVTPGNITGTTPVCQAQNNVSYSLPSIQYAISYLWNYSGTGGTITNSGNTISINFSTTATSGNLSVKGQNSCGDGPLSPNFIVSVNPIPQVSLSVCNPRSNPRCTVFCAERRHPVRRELFRYRCVGWDISSINSSCLKRYSNYHLPLFQHV